MKNYIYIANIFFVNYQSNAQKNIILPNFNYNNYFFDFINENVIKENVKYSFCLRFVASVKIELNDMGTITSVAVSQHIPEAIQVLLTDVVWSTKNMWTPMYINDKAVPSYPIIQVIHFEMAARCEPPHYKPLNSIKTSTKYLFTYSNEGKPSEMPLNSILLPPKSFFVDYGYTDLNPIKK